MTEGNGDMGFWEFLWLMIWGVFFVAYLMVLFQVIIDIFRDRELNGWVRASWLIALFIAPPLTGLVYVIARGRGMGRRQYEAAAASKSAADDYIRSVSGSTDAAGQIARAKSLLDSGAITQAEFDQLKAKALA